MPTGMFKPGHNNTTKALHEIESFKVDYIKPIYGGSADELVAIQIKIYANGYIPAYLTWEGSGGAVALWFKSPYKAYEDLMSAIWNASVDRTEPGYTCEPFGMYDQWIFPVDNAVDLDEPVARTEAEQRLYQFAALSYETFAAFA